MHNTFPKPVRLNTAERAFPTVFESLSEVGEPLSPPGYKRYIRRIRRI